MVRLSTDARIFGSWSEKKPNVHTSDVWRFRSIFIIKIVHFFVIVSLPIASEAAVSDLRLSWLPVLFSSLFWSSGSEHSNSVPALSWGNSVYWNISFYSIVGMPDQCGPKWKWNRVSPTKSIFLLLHLLARVFRIIPIGFLLYYLT